MSVESHLYKNNVIHFIIETVTHKGYRNKAKCDIGFEWGLGSIEKKYVTCKKCLDIINSESEDPRI